MIAAPPSLSGVSQLSTTSPSLPTAVKFVGAPGTDVLGAPTPPPPPGGRGGGGMASANVVKVVDTVPVSGKVLSSDTCTSCSVTAVNMLSVKLAASESVVAGDPWIQSAAVSLMRYRR